MRGLNIKKLFLSLLVLVSPLILSGCKIKVKNTRICSVAGLLTAGMDCAYTLSDKTEELSMKESLEFLHPQPEREDPAMPGKKLPKRAGAICQSADDWNSIATSLELACDKIGCDTEVVEIVSRISKLSEKSLSHIDPSAIKK